MKLKNLILILILFCFLVVISATDWFPEKIKCPICHKNNDFNSIASYGGYIYNWPSKYHYIFWPATDDCFVYTCKKCNFSSFMYDFKKEFSKDEIEDIKLMLSKLQKPKKVKKYSLIPISQRLSIAENCYKFYKKNDWFWCEFYRIKAYHLDKEEKYEEARESRKNSLELINNIIRTSEDKKKLKEYLIIRGSLNYFLNNIDISIADLKLSTKQIYINEDWTENENKNMNEYLTGLANEFLTKIESKENLLK